MPYVHERNISTVFVGGSVIERDPIPIFHNFMSISPIEPKLLTFEKRWL